MIRNALYKFVLWRIHHVSGTSQHVDEVFLMFVYLLKLWNFVNWFYVWDDERSSGIDIILVSYVGNNSSDIND